MGSLQPVAMTEFMVICAGVSITQCLEEIKASKSFILFGEIHLSPVVHKVQELPVVLRYKSLNVRLSGSSG